MRNALSTLLIAGLTSLQLCAAPYAVSAAAQGPGPGAQPSTPAEKQEGFKLISKIPYAPDRKLLGDMYLPDPPGGAGQPAVLIVHGGAFRIGDRLTPGEVNFAGRLARHGYVAFCIDYRLVKDGGIYPQSVKDVNDAFGYMVAHAAQYGIDPNRIAVFGASAGATLALLSAYAPHAGKFAPLLYKDTKERPRVVAAFAPLTDLKDTEQTWVIKWMDDTPWHSPELYAEASPITYVSGGVPTLLVHGTRDVTVDYSQSDRLAKALQAAGVPVVMVPLKGARHLPMHEEPGPIREKVWAELLRFLDANLKPAPPRTST